MNRAAFIDKDGTLVHNVPYNIDIRNIQLVPDAGEALRALQHAGYKIIIVSNQSGVARGMFLEKDLYAVVTTLQHLLLKEGVYLDDFYYCPHHPEGIIPEYAVSCECRKPEPGLFFQAAKDYGIDLQNSWMIGDILHDTEAGNRAGCKSILIDNGNETEWDITPARTPDHIVNNLAEAAKIINSHTMNKLFIKSNEPGLLSSI